MPWLLVPSGKETLKWHADVTLYLNLVLLISFLRVREFLLVLCIVPMNYPNTWVGSIKFNKMFQFLRCWGCCLLPHVVPLWQQPSSCMSSWVSLLDTSLPDFIRLWRVENGKERLFWSVLTWLMYLLWHFLTVHNGNTCSMMLLVYGPVGHRASASWITKAVGTAASNGHIITAAQDISCILIVQTGIFVNYWQWQELQSEMHCMKMNVGHTLLDCTKCGAHTAGLYQMWGAHCWTVPNVGHTLLDCTKCGAHTAGLYQMWRNVNSCKFNI